MKLGVLPKNDNNNGWLRILPELPTANVLTDSHTFDYAVVGAGYTGLAAARRLAELLPDARIALIDAGRVGNNAAGRCSTGRRRSGPTLRAIRRRERSEGRCRRRRAKKQPPTPFLGLLGEGDQSDPHHVHRFVGSDRGWNLG